MKNVIVLGAGLAGLSVAYELSKNNIKIDIIEKDSQVGGLAKSFIKDGIIFDLGPHRFLSKDNEMLTIINELIRDNILIERIRKSRIYIKGNYYNWPLRISNAVFTLPPLTSAKIFLEYLPTKAKRNKIDDSFESYVINRFGKTLHNIFFRDYNKKLWGLPSNEISVDWAQQRIGLTGITDAIKQAVFKSQRQARTNAEKFHYPKYNGIGSISLKFQEFIEKKGNKIYLNSYPIKIKDKEVTFMHNNKKITKTYDKIISTIPLTDAIKLFDNIPLEIKKASSSLKFRSIVFVYLVLNKERLGNDHWIYFPDPEEEIFFNRFTEMKNFSEETCPKDKTIIIAEITCNYNDKTWLLSEKELIKKTKDKLIDLGFIKNDDILDSFIKKETHAYLVYNINYKENKDKVLDFLGKTGIYSIGRNALFRYNNMDHSIDMGFKLAKHLLGHDIDYKEIATEKKWFG